MKQHLSISLFTAILLSSNGFANDTSAERFEKLEKEMAALHAELNALKEENTKLSSQLAKPLSTDTKSLPSLSASIEDLQDQVSTINKKTNGNNLKWGVDFRTSADNLNYTMANGTKARNDAVFSNRLWLNMKYTANKNLSFQGQLAYNKLFGQRTMLNSQNGAMDSFDWVSSENKQDDTLRVRSVSMEYTNDNFLGMNIPWSWGIGRRPSTNGELINYRDDDKPSFPLGSIINAEFDGGNIKFNLDKITGLEGSSIKFAAGRGMTNAEPRFSAAPYSNSSLSDARNISLYGINLIPYKTSKIETEVQYTHGNNLIDVTNTGYDQSGKFTQANYNPALQSLGALQLGSAFVSVHEIGNGISNYWDNSLVFISGSMSKTAPNGGQMMLGSTDSKAGYSYWIGTQMPSLISEKGKWGLEFNHGSEYWRPFTYAEDTMIGSKIAARGDAYEIYFTEPLLDALSFQLRYTYINYNYTGSNGFFGPSGAPIRISDIPASSDLAGAVVNKAQDIRAYLRYRF